MPENSHREKFYVTTPIYYVNARPHIGHAYSTIVADVLARRHRLLGDDTFFLTGTDEHGQKIERSAAAAGVAPQEFADTVSKTFSDLWVRMGITNDAFIRTTDERHKRGVQKLFRELYEAGHIYLSTYTGQYSIGEEMFVDGPPGTIGPDGRPTETVTEENFFFRLSAFQLPLLDLIESDTLKITPESSRNEVLSFVRGDIAGALRLGLDAEGNVLPGHLTLIDHAIAQGRVAQTSSGLIYIPGALKDLSVSRSSFTWGIPVPEEVQLAAGASQKHVVYVWLDALANYMTAVGYGSDAEADREQFARCWPADLHLVGKEITRFHCVYWPAFLLAAGLPLPKQVTANGWLLFDNSKMSKSKGNVVRTETILDGFGDHVYGKQFPESSKEERDLFASDVLRYFLLREIPFGQDGSFSFEAMVTRYNADLANGYGNLVSRTLSMIEKFAEGVIPYSDDKDHAAYSDIVDLGGAAYLASLSMLSKPEAGTIGSAIAKCMFFATKIDGFLTARAPWKLSKGDSADHIRLESTLYVAAESIRILTALLHPIIPFTTAKVWSQLGLGSIEEPAARGELASVETGILVPGTKLGFLSSVFPRADKSLPQVMMEMEVVTPPLANGAKDGAPGVSGAPVGVGGGKLNFVREGTFMPTEDTSQMPAIAGTHPAAPLKDQSTPTPALEVAGDPTHPAAPPRTSSLEVENSGGQVAGSHAVTTERVGTPPHSTAAASGIFAGSTETAQIGIEDFVKVDLRVAKIVVAERIPKADKLLRLEVDLGYEQRQILSGIAEWYTPEELVGRKIVIIANLAPRKMRGLESRGMLLAASEGEGGKPVLATFGEEIAVGTRLK